MAGIDAFAKRYHPFIVGGLLLAVAYFQGRGIANLIAEQLPVGPSGETSKDPEAALAKLKAAGNEPKTKSGAAILARNPFDSVTGPIGTKPATPAPKPSERGPATRDDRPPKCTSGSVTLITGSLDPAYSFAVITTGGQSKMRRVGDDVEGKKVESIHGESVVLASDSGERCRLTMHDDAAAPAGAAGRVSTDPRRSARDDGDRASPSASGGSIGGIRKVSDTEYVIEENGEQKLTAMKQAFLKSAKLVEGKGLRLYRSSQTTILRQLGLKQGDYVKSVNGYDMSNLDQSTEAYEKLPSAKSVQVVVERDGNPVTLDYSVK